MATVPTFKAGELLTAQKLNDALAATDDAVQTLIDRMNNDEILINGQWYRRSGKVSARDAGPANYSAMPVVYWTAYINYPFSPPPGWGFEFFPLDSKALVWTTFRTYDDLQKRVTVDIYRLNSGDFVAPDFGYRLIKTA
ncbi:hypothetical protein QEV12_10495 [Trueperella pyogenes]|uniref:hypothetical protein n=1 Tax=Trueperella pyogenes TaxID=1661 RepID=UPI0024BF6AA5|nr:hypothetical protein [Trueperella pyogenes]WHU59086.1 hypothetical protein QEV21_00180 [Trueperella pyogenes]